MNNVLMLLLVGKLLTAHSQTQAEICKVSPSREQE